jgi:hypothetical protein
VEDMETEGVLHTEDHSRNREVDLIMATMPGLEAPRRRASSATQQTIGATSGERGEDWFPPFNLENDIRVGQFIALTIEHEELRTSISFYVGKVHNGNGQKK